MTRAVGFVGLGQIGRPMARCLVGSDGIDLRVCDVDPRPVAELVSAGATAAPSLAALAAGVEVVCVMVRDDAQVRAVFEELLAGALARPPGVPLTVAVHSTVGPDTPAALAERAAPYGVAVVDAPVSGGAVGAADGRLAVMVGGTPEAFAAVRPVMEALASLVVHAGPVGSGTRLKLARNLIHFVSFTAVTEAQRLAEAAGLNLLDLGRVVRHSDTVTGGPGAIMHRPSAAPIPEGDFWYDIFSHVAALGDKDLRYAIDLAGRLGVEVPLAESALRRLAPGLGVPSRSGTGPAGDPGAPA